MSDIFREVDEEVRRSQAEALWRRYGSVVLAVCIAVVAAVGGWRYLEFRRTEAAGMEGAKFQDALKLLQDGKASEGEAALTALVGSSEGIYRALARFRLAGEVGKRDAVAGIAAFDQVAGDAALDPHLRDAARLRAAALASETMPFADLEKRLQPLLAASNAWRHQAAEILALSALKAGDQAAARKHFDQIIVDRAAPEGLRSRAELLIGLTRDAK